ncbi:sterol 14-alpha-demethylase [Acrasis kona]|uniref:Sterol 14-alpha-demethylase n=1 Tax=Acrasis kona TaxID=1008807 RepID=A0AAW2YJ80_9EUKA
MIAYILLAVVVVLALFVYVRETRYKQPPLITGYGSIPIISPLLAFASDPRDLFTFVSKKYAKEGVARISAFGYTNIHIFFGTPFLEAFFKSPETELSLEQAAKFAVGPLLGDISTMQESSKVLHKVDMRPQQPKKLSGHDWISESITTPSQLDFMFDTASEVVNKYMDEFVSKKTTEFDLFKEMYNIVVSVNVRCFVGDEVLEYLDEMTHLLWVIEYYGTTMTSLFNPYSAARKKSVAARHRIVEIIGKIREKRMKNIDEGTYNGARDVLQVNIEMGKSDAYIAMALLSIFFAAQTNTVSTSAWTLAYLATHPEWQEKVREEIPSEELTNENARDLPILGAALSETVRRNALAFIFRKALKNVEVNGYTIKKGDMVVISPSIVHADESFYPEPEKWKPERFIKDGMSYKMAALKFGKNFIQWGFNSHRCLGEQFANIVMKLIITNFLRRYKVSTNDKLELDFTKALGMPFAKGDIMMKVEPLH